jgi:hypothetical protein
MTTEAINSFYDGLYRNIVGTAETFRIRNGFTDTESLDLASAIKSEEIFSGAVDDIRGKGMWDREGYSREYDLLNKPMNIGRGVNPLHMINAYASAESSGTSLNIRRDTFLTTVINGTVNIDYTDENKEQYNKIREEQINKGTFMPTLIEAVADSQNRVMLDFIKQRITNDRAYSQAIEDIIPLTAILRN